MAKFLCLTMLIIGAVFSITPLLTAAVSIREITDLFQNAMKEVLKEAALTSLCDEIMLDQFKKFKDRAKVIIKPVMLKVNEGSTVGLFELFPLPGAKSNKPVIPVNISSCDRRSHGFILHTRPFGSITLIPDVMKVANVRASLSMVLPDVNTMLLVFYGDWVISSVTIRVKVTYTAAIDQFDITANPSGLKINAAALVNDLLGLKLPESAVRELSFDSLMIHGIIDADRTITLIIKHATNDSKEYLIYHKPNEQPSQKAVAIEVSDLSFGTFISKEIRGFDISRIPKFGSTVVQGLAVTLASTEIDGLPEGIFSESNLLTLLTSNGTLVPNQQAALIQFDFIDVPLKFTSEDGTVMLEPLEEPLGLTFGKLFSAIPGIDLKAIPVPFDLKFLDDTYIVSFFLTNDVKKAISIKVRYDKEIGFFNDQIEIRNSMTTIHLSRAPTRVRAEVSGEMTIGKTTFSVSLSLDKNNNYIIQASTKDLPITDAITQFHANLLPQELNSLQPSLPFASFSVMDAAITYPIATRPQMIHLAGTPVVAGYQTVQTDIIIIRQGGKALLVEGFALGAVNLADFLHTISGLRFNSIAMLNQDIQAAIVISPVSLPNLKLHGERLQQFSITKGISIQAEMGFPKHCSSDRFCAVAQSLLGKNARLNVQGTFTSPSQLSLFAGVSNVRVGRGLVLTHAGLEVQSGAVVSVGLTGSIVLSNPPLTLTSKIFLSTSGVVLEMTMSGCWHNAFGARWLSICNILGAIGMVPGVSVTSLEMGGKVRFGDTRCARPIVATGFFGVDAVTPTNNYYYVLFSGKTTVRSTLRAFCVNTNLPRPLAESGFPRGFLSSFSVAGRELPHASISIPAGFRLKGTLNILGLEGHADVTIGLPQFIDITVALPPIVAGGGLLRMTISSRDSSRGPHLRAKISLSPARVDIHAQGYLRVLGISVGTTLRITNTEYQFHISGKMLNLFQASLHITATYGSIRRASFRARGHFRNDLYRQLEQRVKSGLQAAANAANSAINGAQNEVNSQHAKFDAANRDLRSAQDKVNGAKRDFDSAERKLRSAQDHVNRVCSIRHCSSHCIGCPTGTECCGRVWGACVCVRPTFSSCCTRVPDPVCTAANAACRGLKETARGALTAAGGVVNAARRSLDVANAALRGAQGVVNAARTSLHAANAVLQAAKHTYRLGTQAASAISSLGINGLVSIREISFDAALSNVNRGTFSGSLRARFLGHAEVTVRLNVNVRDIQGMAKQIAEQMGRGFSSLLNG